MPDSHPAKPSSERTPGGRVRGSWSFALVALLAGVYFLATSGVRSYVDGEIRRTVGSPVPEFELLDRNGRTWTAADLRGRTTLLNFFRSKCPSCLRERDAIRRLVAESDPADVQVLGVMTDRLVAGISEEETGRTLTRYGYTHPILMADRQFADAFYGAGWAHVTPVTYIVDAKGRIKEALRGEQTFETLRSATR